MIQLLREFAGYPVRQFEPEAMSPQDFAASAVRLGLTGHWEVEDEVLWKQYRAIVVHPQAAQIPALAIGNWPYYPFHDRDALPFLHHLIEHRERFPNLQAMFLGTEALDWIKSTGWGDLHAPLAAFPELRFLGVRGTSGLSCSPVTHDALTELVIEGAGLERSFVEGLSRSTLPELARLELWLGSEDCGFSASPDCFKELFHETPFPKLKHLGLRNAESADAFAEALRGAPIVKQLESLDLSLGYLTDAGAAHLLDNPAIAKLKTLDCIGTTFPPTRARNSRPCLRSQSTSPSPTTNKRTSIILSAATTSAAASTWKNIFPISITRSGRTVR